MAGETQPILANAAARLAHNPATQIIGGIAIDGSGNLWVANGVTASPTFNKNPSAVPSGEQMVGIHRSCRAGPHASGTGTRQR